MGNNSPNLLQCFMDVYTLTWFVFEKSRCANHMFNCAKKCTRAVGWTGLIYSLATVNLEKQTENRKEKY